MLIYNHKHKSQICTSLLRVINEIEHIMIVYISPVRYHNYFLNNILQFIVGSKV